MSGPKLAAYKNCFPHKVAELHLRIIVDRWGAATDHPPNAGPPSSSRGEEGNRTMSARKR